MYSTWLASIRSQGRNAGSWSVWRSWLISMREDRFNELIGWTALHLKQWTKLRRLKIVEMEVLICMWLLIFAVLNIELFSRYLFISMW